MKLTYIDPQTGKVFPNVHVHNFANDEKSVRIMANSTALNPEDKTYPDKKWVSVTDLYVQAEFTPEFIKANKY